MASKLAWGGRRLCTFATNSKLLGICARRKSNISEQLFILHKVEKSEEVIKKSRFIGIVSPVASIEEALSFIESCRDSRATHTCWAYVVGDITRSSDDGEPSGTAGRPMLAALTNEGVTNVAAAVIRYYGGINLGTGGLARAYGGAVSLCLRNAQKIPLINKITITATVDVQLGPHIYAMINNSAMNSIEKLSEDFTESGNVQFRLSVPEQNIRETKDLLLKVTKGQVSID